MAEQSNTFRYTIKQMPEASRPRERLAERGAQVLSDQELVAIVLRTGSLQATALELASQMLTQLGGLNRLAAATLQDLVEFRGVGLAKAVQLLAAIELGRRIAAAGPEMRPAIGSPEDASALVMEEMRRLDREVFRILCLNTKNRVIANELISQGSLNASLVHPREVFKTAIRHSSAAILLVHNHPSGDPAPSQEDLGVTRRLLDAARIMDIEILDHIIIGDGRYISLKEQGFM